MKTGQTYMKTQPILPLVLSMSLPMVCSMLVNSLYNIVDGFFVAKISEDAMTALSLVFPIQNLINAVSIGFSIGVNAVIAQSLGAEDLDRAGRAASQGMLLSGMHGLVLMLGSLAAMPSFLGMFTTEAQVIELGLQYANIAFLFSIIIALSMAQEKLFQAEGRMRTTMLCMLSGCLTNIILDPILIFGPGPVPALGMRGAALATGIGQLVNLALYVVLGFLRPLRVRLHFPRRLERETVLQLYATGVPAALNLALPSLLISSLNRILAAYAQSYVLVLGAYYKLQTFLYLPANGIVQGLRPLVGYNYGAKEHRRVREIYLTGLGLAAGIMVLGTILCWAVPGRLIGLFTANAETIRTGEAALRIISGGMIVSAVSVISCGALEGLGKGGPSLLISLLRYALLIIPAAWLFSRLWGPAGVWNAFWVSELLTAVTAWQIYRRATAVNGPADRA